MDQIANLVIDLSIDSAEFRNEVPRIKKLLNDAAGDSERSAARMQRFLDKQTEATRRTSASLEQVTASSTAYSSAVEKSAAASTRLAADVDQTRQRVEALGRKLREEQAQSAAVAAAQDRTSAAFYRQIDSVKQLSGGLQELQRIQAQVRDQLSRMNLITLPPIRQKMPAAAAPGDAPCVTIPETLAVSSPLINFHSKSS